MLRRAVSWAATLWLRACGWRGLTAEQMFMLKKYPRAVVIFPHTTYWDAILFLVYGCAYPQLFGDFYAFLNEGFYKRAPRLFRRLGFLCATRAEAKGQPGGTVERTCAVLKDQPRYKVLLSPEGKLIASPWRSGYYYLANALDCPVAVVGLDYETRTVEFCPPRDCHEAKETLEPKLQSDMSTMVPLHPLQSFVPVRKHLSHNVHAVDPILLTSHLGALSLVVVTLWQAFALHDPVLGLTAFAAAVCGLASGCYHYHQESCSLSKSVDMTMCLITYLMYALYAVVQIPGYCRDPMTLRLQGAVMYCYWAGSGRRAHLKRQANYTCYHSMFHIMMSALGHYTVWCHARLASA